MLSKKNNYFERVSAKIFMFSMIANGCGYLFQIIMGHMLSVENYGIINALIALMSILSAPGSVIAATVTKYSAENMKTETKDRVALVYRTAVWLTIMIQLLMLFGALLFSRLLQNMFHIGNEYIIVTITVSAISLMPFAGYSVLQGVQEYITYGIQEVILNLSKLVISIFLVYMGLKVYGVLLALAVAYLLQSFYCSYKIKYIGIAKKYTLQECFKCLKGWKQYIFSAVWVRIAILIMMNMDTLLVKMLYSDYEVGIFSSGMVIAKIGMYIATALVVPMVPMVIAEKTNQKKVKELITKTFVYGIGSTFVYSIFLITVGKYIINLVFGERYLESVYIFPYICFYVIGITGMVIVMNYALASGKMTFFVSSMFVGIVVIFVGVKMISVPINILFIYLSIIINVLLILNIIYIFRSFQKEKIKIKNV